MNIANPKIGKILFCLLGILVATTVMVTPVFAECPDGTIPTAILGDDDTVVKGTNGERCLSGASDGTALGHTLKVVIETAAIGVGILGVLGITVVGVQYLTAKGNEYQASKAKTRFRQIVIGLVAYVSLSGAAYFLLPDSSFNTDDIHWDDSSSNDTTSISNSSTNNPTSSSNKTESSSKVKETSLENSQQAKRIKKLQDTVKAFAWPKYHDPRSYSKSKTICGYNTETGNNDKCTHYSISRISGGYSKYASYKSSCKDADCGVFVSAAIRHSGWDSHYSPKFGVSSQYIYLKNSSKWKDITKQAKSIGNSYLEPGDIIITRGQGHVFLYANVPGFRSKFVEASHCHYVAMSTSSGRRNIKKILATKSHGNSFAVFRRVKW